MYTHFDSETWLTPFGLIFIVAILAAWALARRNAAMSGIDVSEVDLLLPVALIVGAAGGTAVAILLPADYRVTGELLDPGFRIRLFAIPATAAITLFIYSRLNRLSFRCLLDIFALPAMVGLMIHRVGCFLAGCCWGDIASHDTAGSFTSQVQTLPFINHLMNGVQYPRGSFAFEQHVGMGLIDPAALSSLPVVPVQLYEAALILVVVLALWRFPWREYPRGSIAVIVTCTYALLRFFLEYLRADGQIIVGNLTITQLQCLLLLSSCFLLPGMLKRPARTSS
jgi:phosphatidylglycerol:prolipoprotein diacylglycerol transferase